MEAQHKSKERKVILKQHRQTSFFINGILFNGISDLTPGNSRVVKMEDYHFEIYKIKSGRIILQWSQLFPCFDASDRMYESRYYRRYMICSSMDEALSKYKFMTNNGAYYSSCSMFPCILAPMVLADDGQDEIEILMCCES